MGGAGQVLATNGVGQLSWTTVATSTHPTGIAGGDLSGSYPNPTITGLDASKISLGIVSNSEFEYLDGVTSSIQVQLDGKQNNNGTLSGLSHLDAVNGIVVQSATQTFVKRTLDAVDALRVSITNADGVSGNPTIDVNGNLLPSPTASGKYLRSTGASTAAWSLIEGSEIKAGTISDDKLKGAGCINGQILKLNGSGGFYCAWETASASSTALWDTNGTDAWRATGNVGVGTTNPTSKLQVAGGVQIGADGAGCSAEKAGTLRYNGANVEYCNGSAWQAFGVSGAGITSFNGSSQNTQSFGAIGTTGSAPAWSTNAGTGVHTLNIPLASAPGVSAGLLSKTEYDIFNAKLGTTTTFSGDISGTYNSTSVDKIKGSPISFAAPASGNFLRFDGTNWVNALLVTADIPNLDTAKITTGILPIARGGTNSGTALNNNRILISTGGAIVEAPALTNGQLFIGSTGAAPQAASLTAGTGVSIINGAGTITISASGTGGTVTNVTGTAPIAVANNTTTPEISISQANSTTDGYLSSTDWNTFNNKQGSITAGTVAQYYRGDKTWTDFQNEVRSATLTGFSAASASIAEASSIVTAFGQAQGQIDLLNTNKLNASSFIDWSVSGVQTIDPSRFLMGAFNRVAISDGTGKLTMATVTSTELNYLSGVTSNIQNQFSAMTASLSINGLSDAMASYGTDNNIFLGAGAGAGIGTITSSYDSIFMGVGAGQNAREGWSVYIGNGIAPNNNGDSNTFIGYGAAAGGGVTTGSRNILVGTSSGSILTTGTDNIVIGHNTNVPAAGTSYHLNIGNTLYGDLSTNKIGIGTASPGTTLDVVGAITTRPLGTSTGQTGQIRLRELLANGAESVILRAPDSLATDLYFTWPSTSGTNGQVLSTNGSGILSWVTAGGGSTLDGLSDVTTDYLMNYNMFLGQNAGVLNTSGAYNVFLGQDTGSSASGAGNSVFVGYRAGKAAVNGTDNTFIGNKAATKLTDGWNNTVLGSYSGQNITSGDDNVIIGNLAGNTLTTGSGNTYIGTAAGENITSGNYNIMIGAYLSTSGAVSNALNIGNTLYGDLSNKRIGIGVQTPSYPLHITSTVNGGSANYYNWGFGTQASITQNVLTPGISLYSTGYVAAAAYIFASDARIKNIIGPSDAKKDLDLLDKIQVTDYTYKDVLNFGTVPAKKVIAQQIEQIYPAAVKKRYDVLPNIMRNAEKVSYQRGLVEIMLKGLPKEIKTGDSLKVLNKKNEERVVKVQRRNGDKLTLDPLDPKLFGEEIFLYGSFVDDFRAVDYEALGMLNISATQELYRKIKEQQREIEELRSAICQMNPKVKVCLPKSTKL